MVVSASGHYLIFDCENQNRNFGEVSNQGQNRLKKITKITHFGETSTIPKTQKKVLDMIISGKDIMVQDNKERS